MYTIFFLLLFDFLLIFDLFFSSSFFVPPFAAIIVFVFGASGVLETALTWFYYQAPNNNLLYLIQTTARCFCFSLIFTLPFWSSLFFLTLVFFFFASRFCCLSVTCSGCVLSVISAVFIFLFLSV
jgi:hypothetical protein